jgi:hypothetical protein
MSLGLLVALLVLFIVVPHHKAKILDVILPNATELELKRTMAAESGSVNGIKMISSKLPTTPTSTTAVLSASIEPHFTPVMMPGEIRPKSLVYSPAEKVMIIFHSRQPVHSHLCGLSPRNGTIIG